LRLFSSSFSSPILRMCGTYVRDSVASRPVGLS
jgi:hypothetical protein